MLSLPWVAQTTSRRSQTGRPRAPSTVVAAGVGAPLYAVQSTCSFSAPGVGRAVRNYVRVQVSGRTLTATVYRRAFGHGHRHLHLDQVSRFTRLLAFAIALLAGSASLRVRAQDADVSSLFAAAQRAETSGDSATALRAYRAIVETAPTSRLAARASRRVAWLDERDSDPGRALSTAHFPPANTA